MEIYAREVRRLTGVSIDVYGFDAGQGLFPPLDYRDCPQHWIGGDYSANMHAVKDKLYDARLVVGDICSSAKTFLDDYNPHPIGFISVDVDQYHATTAILDMLTGDNKHFLPFFPIYFDDIFDDLEFQGEMLAIHEFNEKHSHLKIAPEHKCFEGDSSFLNNKYLNSTKMKIQHRFKHPKYPSTRTNNHTL